MDDLKAKRDKLQQKIDNIQQQLDNTIRQIQSSANAEIQRASHEANNAIGLLADHIQTIDSLLDNEPEIGTE